MGWWAWAAVQTAVREASRERSCCLQVAATDSSRSTKRLPAALWVPKLPLRQSTAGRIACSAALLVGSTPGTVTKVHNAGHSFSKAVQKFAVFSQPHG